MTPRCRRSSLCRKTESRPYSSPYRSIWSHCSVTFWISSNYRRIHTDQQLLLFLCSNPCLQDCEYLHRRTDEFVKNNFTGSKVTVGTGFEVTTGTSFKVTTRTGFKINIPYNWFLVIDCFGTAKTGFL